MLRLTFFEQDGSLLLMLILCYWKINNITPKYWKVLITSKDTVESQLCYFRLQQTGHWDESQQHRPACSVSSAFIRPVHKSLLPAHEEEMQDFPRLSMQKEQWKITALANHRSSVLYHTILKWKTRLTLVFTPFFNHYFPQNSTQQLKKKGTTVVDEFT